ISYYPYGQRSGIQPFLFMLTILICTLSIFQSHAADTVPISESITVSFEQTSLKDIITLLEEETPYRFFYNHRSIDDSKKITVHLVKVPVQAAISELLKDV